jgi:hypothetical protein
LINADNPLTSSSDILAEAMRVLQDDTTIQVGYIFYILLHFNQNMHILTSR